MGTCSFFLQLENDLIIDAIAVDMSIWAAPILAIVAPEGPKSLASSSGTAQSWPKEWSTQFNKGNPMKLYNPKDKFNYEVYISSSPAVFCPEGIFICF